MNSKDEKREAFLESGRLERWVYVSELRDLLSEFPDDAWVLANDVGNLNVYTIDAWIATINFGQTGIEWWTEYEDEQLD